MRKKPPLSTKVLAMGMSLLLVALVSISFTLWVTWQLEGGAAAVNEAGRLRMNMLRILLAQQNESPAELARLRQRFDDGLELLRSGDPVRPLAVPWNDETRAQYEHIRAQWLALQAEWALNLPADDGAAAVARGDAFVSEIDDFVQAIEWRIMRWTATLHLFQLFMMALAIAAVVAFMALSHLLVLNPVTRLQQALARVRQGDLGTRLEVDTDDEFGQLADGFIRMTRTLQASHQNLERKVRERNTTSA